MSEARQYMTKLGGEARSSSCIGYPRVKIRCLQRPYFPRKHPPRDASYSSHQPRAPDGRKSELYSSTEITFKSERD